MTRQEIEAVFERVKTWPLERQEEVATALLEIDENDPSVYRLSDVERMDIRAGIAEADRGEFASEVRIRGLLAPGS